MRLLRWWGWERGGGEVACFFLVGIGVGMVLYGGLLCKMGVVSGNGMIGRKEEEVEEIIMYSRIMYCYC